MANPFDADATAYDEVQVSSSKTTTSTVVTTVGAAQMSNAYEATVNDVSSANAAVADHNPPPETPNWLTRCFNWMPLRWFLFVSGLSLTSLSVADMALNGTKVKGIGNVIFFLLFCLGILIMIVEGPVMKATRGCQLGIYFWFRLLSRLWGRAWFYLFIALLTFSQFPGVVTATAFVGFYMIFLVPIMFVVSRSAAQKYQRIFVFVSAGTEGPERDTRFSLKFDELDTAKTGFISSTSIVDLAGQAGRTLSNSERHAIQTFLDAGTNGKVSKDDFMKQFRDYNLKQRFL